MAVIGGVVTFVHVTRDRGPEVIVLRPVDAQGNVQDGWQERTPSRGSSPIDCSYGEPSPYDVGSSIRFCGSTADSADACWSAADTDHVLCVRDPFTKVVDLLAADGLSSPRKPAEHGYQPFGLVLDNGRQCRARIGGAWSSPVEHPDWVGYFGCGSSPRDFTAVWAPPDSSGTSGGITRNDDGWSVMVGPAEGHLTSQRVTTVYYVGVAGDHDAFSDADHTSGAAGRTGGTRGHSLDRDHCYAKLVSTTHPVDGSTAFNP